MNLKMYAAALTQPKLHTNIFSLILADTKRKIYNNNGYTKDIPDIENNFNIVIMHKHSAD